jgi:hypothetical protein
MLIVLLFWISAIWVFFDAKSIGVKKGLITGLGNMGPVGWFFVTLLLWIVGFPMYLYYRGDFKKALSQLSDNSSSGSVNNIQSDSKALVELEKLGTLKEKGLITQVEFDTKKKQLLGL